MNETIPSNPPAQLSNVVQPKPALAKISIILSSLLLLFAFGGAAYLFIQNKNNSEKLNSLTAELAKKDEEIKTKDTENSGLKVEIGSLGAQVEEYVKKVNEIENPPYFTNYLPVKYLFEKPQKLGQSFHQSGDLKLGSIRFKGSFGVGGDVVLRVYELNDPKTVDLTNPVAEGTFPAGDIVKEKSFDVGLNTSVTLVTDKDYFFSLEPVSKDTQAGIAFAEKNIVDGGKMYIYTRMIGGNGEIVDPNHSWQSKNNYDVVFTLLEAK